METMIRGKERAEQCVEQAGHADEALGRITEAVEGINELNSHIAVAAEQQKGIIESINSSIQSIGHIAVVNAESLSRCVSSSDNLVTQAGELHAKVTRFRV